MIALSYAVSFLGAFVAVSFCEQFRLVYVYDADGPVKMLNSKVILATMALLIGGVAIWCMHFIGMGALELRTEDGVLLKVHFDIGLTILSIIVAIAGAYVGLLISTYDRVYTKTKDKVLDMLVVDACQAGTKITAKKSVLTLALFKGLHVLAIGGIAMASGVCAMHYLGMYAMRFDGYMEWDVGVIAASVAIAIVVSIVAFWILFRFLALFPQRESLRVMSAAVMGVAVCGMHYTGMYGAKFYYEPGKLRYDPSTMISSDVASYAALVVGVGLSWVLNIIMIADVRAWYYHQSKIVEQTDELMKKAVIAPTNELKQLHDKYVVVRGKSSSVVPDAKFESNNEVMPFANDKFSLTKPHPTAGGSKAFAIPGKPSQAFSTSPRKYNTREFV